MRRTLHHEGPRSSTKPCGIVFVREGPRSHVANALRRKASCPFVPLRGEESAAWLRASSCLFVVKTTAARLRVPSCPFVVKPSPHGFVSLRASSWSNLRRKASCFFVLLRGKNHRRKASRSLVAQRALRATKNHSAWSSRPLAALRGQNFPNPLRRKASCSFVSLRGQPSSARLRASSCLFVVKTTAARLRVP